MIIRCHSQASHFVFRLHEFQLWEKYVGKWFRVNTISASPGPQSHKVFLICYSIWVFNRPFHHWAWAIASRRILPVNPVSTNLMPRFFCYKISFSGQKKYCVGYCFRSPQMFSGKGTACRVSKSKTRSDEPILVRNMAVFSMIEMSS